MNPDWICCQLGAREHYTIPRALKSQGKLALLVTEAWAESRLPFKALPGGRARERFQPELQGACIESWDWKTLAFELSNRLRLKDWDLIRARNEWFQNNAIKTLQSYASVHPARPVIVFCFSYAARRILAFAKSQGWETVLGQIDPGPVEEDIVVGLTATTGQYRSDWSPAPTQYWDDWREECDLADHIIVNSGWSRDALVTAGVTTDKLIIAPVAFKPSQECVRFHRSYPKSFDRERPLRALFLGQVCLRKGISVLLDAIQLLRSEPIEFNIVGPRTIEIPEQLRDQAGINWVDAIPRSAVAQQYQNNDVFLFPTFSDGFGLTQLEAQSWKLPAIVSRHCGEVTEHLKTGYVLEQVAPESLANALRWFVQNPGALASMANSCRIDDRFTLSSLAATLSGIGFGAMKGSFA